VAQWMGSDNRVKRIWLAKSSRIHRFRSKGDRWVLAIGARLARYLGSTVMPQKNSICRFGVFELNLRSGELRKQGIKLRLQDQPYQVLVKLIEHNGEIVSREELRSALWHEDTFVDFETGLNTAIKRLRETLGDSAENPTFIETLPKRGYRFISTIDSPARDRRRPLNFSQRFHHSKRFRGAIGIAGLCLLILIGIEYRRSRPEMPVVTKVVRITNDGKAKNPRNPPVTDGVHLYFIEGMPFTTGSGIAQVSDAGGETTWIETTLQGAFAVSSVSPDRSQLFVARSANGGSAEIDLWAQPLPAGTPHPVGNIHALLATWTPDGTHIVYGDGDTIMVANGDGSEPRKLAKVPGMVFLIRYSPDGRRIRFDLTDTKIDSNSIWEMDADGKNAHPLFPDWKESTFQGGGSWSPDGNFYYFVAGRDEAQGIWVVREHSPTYRKMNMSPSRLTSGPLRYGPPVPSRDGKRLFVLGEEPRVELLSYDAKARRFDPFLSGLSAGGVAFSADQNWIAYVSYPDMSLWRSRVDGRDKMQLTFPPARVYGPRWSPDGSQIAFMDIRFNSPWTIYKVSPHGGTPEAILVTDTNYADPTWTPDGKSIVVGKNDELGGIYRLELSSKGVLLIPGSNGFFSPRVSPDGRYISALTVDSSKLMMFDTKSQQWSKLMEGEQLGYNEWSHDGRYIFLRQIRGDAAELVRVRVADRTMNRVLSLKEFPQLSDTFSLTVGLTPTDAPLLMRDRSIQEIYALELQFH
jgi:Tol biopolymer transport system component/DNA-binding winged helix-turn-helix (wHTH) protein